ncbi:U3 snoRNP protein, partial [Cryomyces antarcticus]
DEISSIASKRSDFEHILNARGSKPADYARYAEYEMNLESLRKKRVHRMGVKANVHTGQRRIFFILDRGTRKFHGDLGLWMQAIEYARKEKAHKKLAQIFTSVLRMHPTKPELWIYAAKYSTDVQADIATARSYMQRGLRFCKTSKLLWLEYAKLEMIYIAKIVARQKILGLDGSRPEKQDQNTTDESESDTIALPDVTAEEVDPGLESSLEEVAVQNLTSTPVLTGAIPIAIFDAATKQFPNNSALGKRFFDMFAEFDRAPCQAKILQHVLASLLKSAPAALETRICEFQQPLVGLEATSAAFPTALGQSLASVKASMQQLPHLRAELATAALLTLVPLTRTEGLDVAIEKVMAASLRKFVAALQPQNQPSTLVQS